MIVDKQIKHKLHALMEKLYNSPELIDKVNSFIDIDKKLQREADRDFKYQVRDELKVILKEIGCK